MTYAAIRRPKTHLYLCLPQRRVATASRVTTRQSIHGRNYPPSSTRIMLATTDPRPAPFGLEAGTGCLKRSCLRISLVEEQQPAA